ncbi:hypothetical protein BLNAU_10079 [Blattamonas nauphoetae]|uniref:Uncharacterized protein n=1 Tax=Blattamonas nauphoetae TaxID=2049346 RepID=A0ABQ9XTY6_9EUKA|nr:hypothetical protein BLNAU_10079 [Blattamonas nauphoetae]
MRRGCVVTGRTAGDTAVPVESTATEAATDDERVSSFSMDCSPFVNWQYNRNKSGHGKAVIFRSLAATLKLQPALDDSLEEKAVEFLEYVDPRTRLSADDFLSSFSSNTGDSSTAFVQCIAVLISSSSQDIATAAMEMLISLVRICSDKLLLTLVQADLIPHLITTLNPLSLSFAKTEDIHKCLLLSITKSLGLSTPNGLTELGIEEDTEQQNVHETVLKQVLVPSEKYIWHLCVNRYSIVDGSQSMYVMEFLPLLLRICAYYEPTMEFVLHMPVCLTIPSCLTFFEIDGPNFYFLSLMVAVQQEWNKKRGQVRQMWKTMLRMLRMEGLEDVIEEKLRNDTSSAYGGWIVINSIEWNTLLVWENSIQANGVSVERDWGD